MIKIGDGIYYITCGEACLVMRESGGGIDDVCFGRRIEFEDDVTALGVSGGAAFRAEITRAGANKNIADSIKLVSAEVVPCGGAWKFPVLRADKTLRIKLAADGLEVELYFTPHTRGGISRRCAVKNTGAKPMTINSLGLGGMTLADDMSLVGMSGECERVPMARMRESYARIAAVGRGDAHYGEAIGFYPIYGGRYVAQTRARRVEFSLPLDKTVAAGERLESPELLCVYSDRGTDGLARAYHDIIRDSLIPEKYAAARRPIACRSTARDADKLINGVRAVGRLGADTYIAAVGDEELCARLGKECAATGVKLGAVVRLECADKSPVARGMPVTDKLKAVSGAPVVDMTNADARRAALAEIDKLAACGAAHIVFENARIAESSDAAFEFDYVASVYGLLGEIARKYPDMIIEGGESADVAQLAFMPSFGFVDRSLAERRGIFDALPPCAVGGIVVPPERVHSAFKTAFDAATIGSLSYMFDPALVDENIARAVRAQIFSYQDDSALAVCGDLYVQNGENGGTCVALVSKDKARAYAVYENDGRGVSRVRLRGLDAHNLYHVRELGKTFSGAALAGYGVDVDYVKRGETAVFHLRQVADYE